MDRDGHFRISASRRRERYTCDFRAAFELARREQPELRELKELALPLDSRLLQRLCR